VTQPIIALIGPTAAGKSALAVELAALIDGEVINADSMQGYIGMDIGTAKVPLADRQGIPHHVIDVWEPTVEISVVEFRDAARAAIEDVQGRGRVPIVVGGSWLYVQAIVDELDFPPTDPQVRKKWQDELERVGSIGLHEELERRDPASAAAILPGNGRRIVRALEVIELTGSFTATLPEPVSWRPTLWWGIDAPRHLLDERISKRVDDMWQAGFVDEVRSLRESGIGRTASKALGYSQILDLLEGKSDEAHARANTVVTTVKFARRQRRRFRADTRITWWSGSEMAVRMSQEADQGTRT